MTPSILLYPERIARNIDQMIAIAGEASRLRTHVKTHKLRELVRMQLEKGIQKFKCATLAEVEMVLREGGKDVLLAYPLLGPGLSRFCEFILAWPDVRFSILVDSEEGRQMLASAAKDHEVEINVFLDIDNGMHRTGIEPGQAALGLYARIGNTKGLKPAGLHVYDGHIHDPDLEDRKQHCDRDFAGVLILVKDLEREGHDIPELVCGGNPSFPIHAAYPERTLSPGTCLLWDFGYDSNYADLDFQYGALVATRVISKPQSGLLTLDLGHKSIGSEMPHPRVHLLGLEPYTVVNHSEEHMVIQVDNAAGFKLGQLLYGIPFHICPTMALHAFAYVVENGKVGEKWEMAARNRRY